ncbi:NADAR family protein [Flavisolibacter sp. BT320]|nr:NADAR family protein [Flavisolibacter longurius]
MTHYSLNWLLDRIENGDKVDYLLFWGHTNNGNETTGKFLFSQWYPSPFTVDGVTYKTAEHWMMAEKARLFGDHGILLQILQADTPKEAKALGRQVKGFIPAVWDERCFQIVVAGNEHKFSQNDKFKDFLLSTGDKIIVEASPVDAIWGNGLPQDHENAYKPKSWRGQNLLGFALMQVRDILRYNT